MYVYLNYLFDHDLIVKVMDKSQDHSWQCHMGMTIITI